MQTETYLMQEKVRLIFARLFVMPTPYADVTTGVFLFFYVLTVVVSGYLRHKMCPQTRNRFEKEKSYDL